MACTDGFGIDCLLTSGRLLGYINFFEDGDHGSCGLPLYRSVSLLSLCPLLCAQNAPPRIRQVGAFEQYIVYWTSEPGWRTELQLRNNRVSADLTVTPALRTASGAETALPPVAIRPGEVVSLDLSEVLMKAAPALIGAYGSVVLRYSSLGQRVLYAAAMVRMVGQPIAYHLDGSFRSDEPTAGSRSGRARLLKGRCRRRARPAARCDGR